MAYITINGSLVKINKSFKMDPNVKGISNALKQAAEKGKAVKMNFAHLHPTMVDTNTSTHYRATYEDNFGPYLFEIHKTDKGYTVISDGNICSKDSPNREHIIWNYENQVAAYMPKVLEAA